MANAGGGERRADLARVVVALVGDGRDHRLHRREPHRQAAGVLLDQDADEPLQRAQDGAVQHHRPVLLAVLADVAGVQPLGQHEVDLMGAALPLAADRVAQDELQLRPIERAFAGIELGIEPRSRRRLLERLLGAIPDLVAAGANRRAIGEPDEDVGKAEVAIDRLEQIADADRLRGDLLGRAEDVGVVLGERAHAHQAVEGAGRLVAVTRAELGHPQRQITVAVQALVEDLHMRRAVHRLQARASCARPRARTCARRTSPSGRMPPTTSGPAAAAS